MGKQMWGPHGICNRARDGPHMGKPIWATCGNDMGQKRNYYYNCYSFSELFFLLDL